MRQISFISANYVARASRYPGGSVADWSKFDEATYKLPPRQQFPSIAADVASAGFRNIDIWTAHSHFYFHGPEGAEAVKSACDEHDLSITSYVGGFEAKTPAEAEMVFRHMQRLGAPIFAGIIWGVPQEQLLPMIDSVAGAFGAKWALENHPEKSTDEMLAKIGRGKYRNCGIALDTGWCGTQGLDALEAVKAVRDSLLIVHLKDVESAGAHDTCVLGDGIVPVEAVVRYLVETDWNGTIGIEHEPFDRDPMPEVRKGLGRLQQWLGNG